MTTKIGKISPPPTAAMLIGAAAAVLAFNPHRIEFAFSSCAPACVQQGETLIHGLPGPDVSWSMPLPSTLRAATENHAPPWSFAALVTALLSAGALLSFLIGGALHSRLCGAAAIAVALNSDLSPNEMGFLTLSILLIGALLVDDAQKSRSWKPAAIGLGIGISLLIRSELFAFPLVLFAFESISRKKIIREQLIGLAIPFLVLIPWAYMNFRLHGRFIPFEFGRAENNIIGGALGMIQTMEGDARTLAGLSPGDSALWWAAMEVLRHPLRFASAFAHRLFYVFELMPFRIVTAAASAVYLRRDRGIRRLSLIAAYFIGIHLLMPLEPRYFTAVTPILGIMVLAFLFHLTPLRAEAAQVSRPALLSVLALSSLAAAGVLSLAAAYPARAQRPDGLARAAAAQPGDYWIVYQRGLKNLKNADSAGAISDLLRANSLHPSAEIRLDYAWALAAANRADSGIVDRFTADAPPVLAVKAGLLGMLYAMERGLRPQAEAAWLAAWKLWADTDSRDRGGDPRAMEVTERLRAVDVRLLGAEMELLSAWRPPLRENLIKATIAIFQKNTAFKSEETRKIFLYAATDMLSKKALDDQSKGDFESARKSLAGIAASFPRIAKPKSDLGVVFALMGRPEEAIHNLREALRLDEDFLPAYITLGTLYQSAGRTADAKALYDRALQKPPSPRQKLIRELIERQRKAL